VRVHGRCFLASSLLIGATVARVAFATDDGEQRGATLAPSALFAIGLGYAGDTFHGGLAASADLEGSRAGDADQFIIRSAVALFAGVRF
jgi:hypothetical protein